MQNELESSDHDDHGFSDHDGSLTQRGNPAFRSGKRHSEDRRRALKARGSRKRPAESQLERQESKEDVQTPWDEVLHRAFVEAIFQIGIRQSSPSVIAENMCFHPPTITSERIKSHLQKLRLHHEKEKRRFLEEYDMFMLQAMKGIRIFRHCASSTALLKRIKALGKDALGGRAAAILTCSVLLDNATASKSNQSLRQSLTGEGGLVLTMNPAGFPAAQVPFPTLSSEEKDSPLGTSLLFVMGLLEHMEKFLMEQRSYNIKQEPSSGLPPSKRLPQSSQTEDKPTAPTSLVFEDPVEKFAKRSRAATLRSDSCTDSNYDDDMPLDSPSPCFDDDNFQSRPRLNSFGSRRDEQLIQTPGEVSRQMFQFPAFLAQEPTYDSAWDYRNSNPLLPATAQLIAAFRPPPYNNRLSSSKSRSANRHQSAEVDSSSAPYRTAYVSAPVGNASYQDTVFPNPFIARGDNSNLQHYYPISQTPGDLGVVNTHPLGTSYHSLLSSRLVLEHAIPYMMPGFNNQEQERQDGN